MNLVATCTDEYNRVQVNAEQQSRKLEDILKSVIIEERQIKDKEVTLLDKSFEIFT